RRKVKFVPGSRLISGGSTLKRDVHPLGRSLSLARRMRNSPLPELFTVRLNVALAPGATTCAAGSRASVMLILGRICVAVLTTSPAVSALSLCAVMETKFLGAVSWLGAV